MSLLPWNSKSLAHCTFPYKSYQQTRKPILLTCNHVKNLLIILHQSIQSIPLKLFQINKLPLKLVQIPSHVAKFKIFHINQYTPSNFTYSPKNLYQLLYTTHTIYRLGPPTPPSTKRSLARPRRHTRRGLSNLSEAE